MMTICFTPDYIFLNIVVSLLRYNGHMKSTYDQIWESALRKLEIRPHSVYELEQKLMGQFSGERGEILKVIEEMKRVNLLNDRQFTEEYVHHLIQKPIGRIKIMVETRRKGLNQDLVDQMLVNENWSEEKSAKKALDEKERISREPDERKRKQKLVNFLRNRGFKDAVIYKLVTRDA
jgi:SOS response regulatory protein OraA/RecX